MSIIVTSFPITEAASFYSNFFKGFVKENIELRFQDESSCDVTDSGGLVLLTNFTDFPVSTGANDGKAIVITGGVYEQAEGIIVGEVIGPDEIFTNIPFVSNATIEFYIVNRFTNLRMSYRFCEFTSQDDQDATNLFGTDFAFYPDNLGRLFIDISLISSLMKPNFDFTNEINTDMSKVFQVQHRPVFDGSSESWVSAHDEGLTAFVPFISAHGGGRVAKYDNSLTKSVPDYDLITRMWRGYKKILSGFLVEDNQTGTFYFTIVEYKSDKTLIGGNTLFTTSSGNGLVNVTIPTLNSDTRYMKIQLTDFPLDLNSESYFTIYDTLLNANEFYLTWASELGTIRNWLFTSKIDFNNKAKYDILQDAEFRQIPNKYDEKLLLQAKGLSEIEKNYVYDIYLSNKIILENDGEEFECIVSKPSFSFENRSNSYICTIEIQKKQRDLMNV